MNRRALPKNRFNGSAGSYEIINPAVPVMYGMPIFLSGVILRREMAAIMQQTIAPLINI